MEAILGQNPLIVTGAGGKLGRILQAGWALGQTDLGTVGICPVWIGRDRAADIFWDMTKGPLPDGLPKGAVVLHLAGVTRGPKAELQVNVDLVEPLLQLCAERQARRLIFASTAAVYPPGSQMAESAALAPSNAYGRSKARAEAVLAARCPIPLTLLRLGNVAGADAVLGPRAPGLLQLDRVAGSTKGPLRSWIGARVLVRAIVALMQRDLPPVLNLAQDPPVPMADLLTAAGLAWESSGQAAAVPVATQDLTLLHSILKLPRTSAAQLAEEAAWAREVLA